MMPPFAKPTEEQVSLFCKDSCTAPTESRSEKSLYQVLDCLAGFVCELENTLPEGALVLEHCHLSSPGQQVEFKTWACVTDRAPVTEQDHFGVSHSSGCRPKPACAMSTPEVDFYSVTPQSLSSSCREPAAEVSGCVWRQVELGCGF